MSEKNRSKETIIIPGDNVSAEELFQAIDRQRISYLEFEMEKIRTSDWDDLKKRAASSGIEWRIRALREKINGRC